MGLAALAPFGFVFLWSSSFVAVRIGLRHLTPLLFVAIRLTGCAVVLLAFMAVLRRPWGRVRPLLHCAVAGALINGIGLMAPHVGLTMTGAAPIALVQSLTPVLTGLAGIVLLHERLRSLQWLGLALGVAGVALVVGQQAAQSVVRVEGMLLGFVGVLGLASGTIWFRMFCRDVPALPGVTAQFLAACLVSWVGTALFERPSVTWTWSTVGAVAWNTCGVSLGGMALYFFMLARGPAARTTANFYMVPGTVAVISWVALGERLPVLAALGIVVAGVGCWLVSSEPSRRRAQA